MTRTAPRVAINCLECGKERVLLASFYKIHPLKFCSKTCSGKYQSRQADARVETQCGYCGKQVVKLRCRVNRRKQVFCSQTCSNVGKKKENAKWRDREQIREYQRKYIAANRAQLNQQARARNAKDNTGKLLAQKRYRESHRAYLAMCARARRAGCRAGDFSFVQWESLKAFYDYRCVCCGRREPEVALEVDHIIALVRGGAHRSDNIQPLCRSCNAQKSANCVDYRWAWHEPFGPFNAKGYRTRDYTLRKLLMLALYGIEIRET